MFRKNTYRLKNYNYSKNRYYFITISTEDMEQWLSKIINGKVILKTIGLLVDKYVNELPFRYHNCLLDTYIIMPNHIHCIILIKNKLNVKNHTISEMVRSLKASVTRDLRKSNPKTIFKWKRSFYDRVIRNNIELYNIREYILKNPFKWG